MFVHADPAEVDGRHALQPAAAEHRRIDGIEGRVKRKHGAALDQTCGSAHLVGGLHPHGAERFALAE
jgi:hypothetical protein